MATLDTDQEKTPMVAPLSNNSLEQPSADYGSSSTDGIIFYTEKVFRRCNISRSTNKNFRQSVMIKVSGKEAHFENFDFRYVDMEDCYFHGATFDNCDFTGAKIHRSNFRTANFNNCKFDYVTITETPINFKQITRQLPDFPNIAQEILQSLRRNAVTLGDMAEVRRLTLLEVDQEREHLRRAIKGNGEYYKKKYGKLSKKIELRIRLMGLILSSLVWGHGERLLNLVFSSALVVVVLSIASVIFDIHASPTMPISNIWDAFTKYFWQNSMDFVGVSGSPGIQQHAAIPWVIALARLVFTGMFVAVIFRGLSRR